MYREGVLTERYAIPTSRILVNAFGGDDQIEIESNVQTDAWIMGGFGNDILIGGGGNNLLIGGDGNDELYGEDGRDILFGGNGRDSLDGDSGEDILLAGSSTFELSDAALFAIQQEWLRPISLGSRVAHLRGEASGGLNGNKLLIGSGPNQTAFDDGARDSIDNTRTKDFVLANSDRAFRDLFDEADFFEELDGEAASSNSSSNLVIAENDLALGEVLNQFENKKRNCGRKCRRDNSTMMGIGTEL